MADCQKNNGMIYNINPSNPELGHLWNGYLWKAELAGAMPF